MFESVKRRWAEARGDVVGKQVDDILLRFDRMNPNSQYFVTSAFSSVLSELEDRLGLLNQWSREDKQSVAKQIMVSARQAYATRGDLTFAETSRLGAEGTALLSL